MRSGCHRRQAGGELFSRLRVPMAALTAVTLLAGCAAALMGRAASSGTTSSAPAQTSKPSASAGSASARTAAQIEQDRQIASTVRNRLLTDAATKSLAVSVDTYQGVVSLHGAVAKAEQRSAAERVARSVAGVRQVRNELRVR